MRLQIFDVEHGPFGQEPLRRVLTTRCDGRIAFEFNPGSWGPRQ
jgi:hypothetical protein